jgi:hypothetical protein
MTTDAIKPIRIAQEAERDRGKIERGMEEERERQQKVDTR